MVGKDGPTWADDQDARWNQRVGETFSMPDMSKTSPGGNGHGSYSGGGCGATLASLLLSVWSGVLLAFVVLGVLGR